MKMLTLEEQRRRIENINAAAIGNRKYFRRKRIHDYLPGQATYNLGDYPAPFSIAPTDYDREMLRDMAANGVKLIQVHEEWNDAVRHLGADKFTCFDPKGMEKFIDLAHECGMKIIPYVSSGFFHEYDPDFDEKFILRRRYANGGMHFMYVRCAVGSPEWRQYLLPRTFAVLDRYDFDGIYNDMGYDGAFRINGWLSREGNDGYDPECEDLLSMIYSEVKRRGGIYKLHRSNNNPAPCLDKVYDYLWIGENVQNTGVGIGKNFEDYVIPCQDKKRVHYDDPDFYYASVIPFLQFPLLTSRGRPLLGKRIEEDIPYYGNENGMGSEYAYNKRIGDYMKAHPNGPYTYSLWSSVPDDVEDYPRWCRFLSLYRPMVAENSVVYVELRESDAILSPLPQEVYASMFVNEEIYLAVSNFEGMPYELKLADTWRDRVTGKVASTFTVPVGKILFLEKVQ